MDEYRIEFEPRALSALRRVNRNDVERILAKIHSLAADPRPAGAVKLQGMGDAFRIRQGDFRIIYTIDDADHVVTITKIGNRRDVYR